MNFVSLPYDILYLYQVSSSSFLHFDLPGLQRYKNHVGLLRVNLAGMHYLDQRWYPAKASLIRRSKAWDENSVF